MSLEPHLSATDILQFQEMMPQSKQYSDGPVKHLKCPQPEVKLLDGSIY